MDLQSIVLSSVVMVGITFGITVLGSYVAYLVKKTQQRKDL